MGMSGSSIEIMAEDRPVSPSKLSVSAVYLLYPLRDMAKALADRSIQLAANGPSLVTKIRVVAVSLLDALPAQDDGDDVVQAIGAYLLGQSNSRARRCYRSSS